MRDERSGDYAAVLVIGLLFLLLAGGGTFFWYTRTVAVQRAQEARMLAEEQHLIALRAVEQAEQARAEAEAIAETEAPAPPAANGNATDPSEAIKLVLRNQQEAWNQGDIDGFMQGYWKSDDLTFSSGGQTTRSWQSTLDRYKTKYATREAMGTLQFSDLEVRALGSDAAYVLGRWSLEGLAAGNFTLVMRKLESGWVVVHDHTSKLEESNESQD